MEKITLKEESGEVFTFTGRRIVSQYLPLGKLNKYGRVEIYETAHNRKGIHDLEKASFILAYETESGKYELEKFVDGWQAMKFFQYAYTEQDHPLRPHAIELARQAAANCGDLNEWYDSQIIAFLKKRRIARERIQVEKEQDALAERERAAEKLAEEKAVEEKILKQQEELKEGFFGKTQWTQYGLES